MKGCSSQPIGTVDAKAAGEPKNERRRKRPEVASGCLEQETLCVADRLPLRVIHEVRLCAEEKRDDRPDSPDQSKPYQASGQYRLVVNSRSRVPHCFDLKRRALSYGRYGQYQSTYNFL